jgi:chromosome segregation ATPase
MDSDSSPLTPPAGEDRAAALAEEVRMLRRLLLDLQEELRPAVQSSLRERSDALQRLGGDLSEREDELRRLNRELEAARGRSEDLEAEVARWKDAARRGVDEVAEKARLQVERFERETAELVQALAGVRAQLETSREQARSLTLARDAALHEVERRKARIRALKAKVVQRERRRLDMMRSPSWRVTAPLRWPPKAWRRLLLEMARTRRRLFGR